VNCLDNAIEHCSQWWIIIFRRVDAAVLPRLLLHLIIWWRLGHWSWLGRESVSHRLLLIRALARVVGGPLLLLLCFSLVARALAGHDARHKVSDFQVFLLAELVDVCSQFRLLDQTRQMEIVSRTFFQVLSRVVSVFLQSLRPTWHFRSWGVLTHSD